MRRGLRRWMLRLAWKESISRLDAVAAQVDALSIDLVDHRCTILSWSSRRRVALSLDPSPFAFQRAFKDAVAKAVEHIEGIGAVHVVYLDAVGVRRRQMRSP